MECFTGRFYGFDDVKANYVEVCAREVCYSSVQSEAGGGVVVQLGCWDTPPAPGAVQYYGYQCLEESGVRVCLCDQPLCNLPLQHHQLGDSDAPEGTLWHGAVVLVLILAVAACLVTSLVLHCLARRKDRVQKTILSSPTPLNNVRSTAYSTTVRQLQDCKTNTLQTSQSASCLHQVRRDLDCYAVNAQQLFKKQQQLHQHTLEQSPRFKSDEPNFSQFRLTTTTPNTLSSKQTDLSPPERSFPPRSSSREPQFQLSRSKRAELRLNIPSDSDDSGISGISSNNRDSGINSNNRDSGIGLTESGIDNSDNGISLTDSGISVTGDRTQARDSEIGSNRDSGIGSNSDSGIGSNRDSGISLPGGGIDIPEVDSLTMSSLPNNGFHTPPAYAQLNVFSARRGYENPDYSDFALCDVDQANGLRLVQEEPKKQSGFRFGFWSHHKHNNSISNNTTNSSLSTSPPLSTSPGSGLSSSPSTSSSSWSMSSILHTRRWSTNSDTSASSGGESKKPPPPLDKVLCHVSEKKGVQLAPSKSSVV